MPGQRRMVLLLVGSLAACAVEPSGEEVRGERVVTQDAAAARAEALAVVAEYQVVFHRLTNDLYRDIQEARPGVLEAIVQGRSGGLGRLQAEGFALDLQNAEAWSRSIADVYRPYISQEALDALMSPYRARLAVLHAMLEDRTSNENWLNIVGNDLWRVTASFGETVAFYGSFVLDQVAPASEETALENAAFLDHAAELLVFSEDRVTQDVDRIATSLDQNGLDGNAVRDDLLTRYLQPQTLEQARLENATLAEQLRTQAQALRDEVDASRAGVEVARSLLWRVTLAHSGLVFTGSGRASPAFVGPAVAADVSFRVPQDGGCVVASLGAGVGVGTGIFAGLGLYLQASVPSSFSSNGLTVDVLWGLGAGVSLNAELALLAGVGARISYVFPATTIVDFAVGVGAGASAGAVLVGYKEMCP